MTRAISGLLLVLLVGCCGRPVKAPPQPVLATNAAGRVFVRITNHAEPPAGTVGQSHVWQPVEDVGPDRPMFLRQLPTPGVPGPDVFIRAL